MRQAVIYLRVSTIEQTTANQERELREIVAKVYRDHGIRASGTRPRRACAGQERGEASWSASDSLCVGETNP